jgi:hypothetical protein
MRGLVSLVGLWLCGVAVVSTAGQSYPPKMPPPPTYEQALEEALKKHQDLEELVRRRNQGLVEESIKTHPKERRP